MSGVVGATHPFDVDAARKRLASGAGGYEVVHVSPGLEIGVYVLVAPEPDRQQPHEDDEVYVALEGSGILEIEGDPVVLREGHAIFVPAGAEHRFVGYEHLALLVIFDRRPRTRSTYGKPAPAGRRGPDAGPARDADHAGNHRKGAGT